GADGHGDRLPVEDGERPREAEAYGADVGVRRRAEGGPARAEDLRAREELRVDLEADDRLPTHGRWHSTKLAPAERPRVTYEGPRAPFSPARPCAREEPPHRDSRHCSGRGADPHLPARGAAAHARAREGARGGERRERRAQTRRDAPARPGQGAPGRS